MTVNTRFLLRRADSHKGDYGHVLVVAGSIGLTGAPVLCALAALRAGAGLVTVGVPESVYFIIASKLNEAMVYPLPESPAGTLSPHSVERLAPLLARADVVALGPGLSQEPPAMRAVQRLVAETELPVVLDADGVNAFSGAARRRLSKARVPVVITPHPGEMARLLGTTIQAVQRSRLRIAAKTARELRAVVVLEGHRSVVASATGRTYVNSTGNPGMATAGMGDMLTGIIAAFIGQGSDPFEAARAGVHLHGLAGDIAARRVGQPSLIASDLLAALPEAFKKAGAE
ncbi:MAG: NAD(P)H-hydrate dehydratase [Candidatus Omnitrophica bacterium]|nr:NAD(P)H-hydrate dehydratase [Candidatus Omnitrophota bacterium]